MTGILPISSSNFNWESLGNIVRKNGFLITYQRNQNEKYKKYHSILKNFGIKVSNSLLTFYLEYLLMEESELDLVLWEIIEVSDCLESFLFEINGRNAIGCMMAESFKAKIFFIGTLIINIDFVPSNLTYYHQKICSKFRDEREKRYISKPGNCQNLLCDVINS